jgi:small neutral amino acid transporter SnatA (MarC family)
MHAAPSDAGALRFFVSQAVGITFEDIVIALAARAGLRNPNRLFKCLGYVWVYCWFAYSLSPWIDSFVTSGGGMTLSLIMGLSRGEWYPKR